ncbi:MAG: hypothetical protein KME15_27640 [Drouetiella hepatica Uher 2000/2452]|jgi:hypothetical protein|uniref:Uncharacterized protein n=1 Tax=Drouetiella hepatica Uher 2000/2452 TaxID=904376 RepID=A0A951USD4_9CYAN|nr:hypothetical protein [Drouetiella hepatica Uher 2000/2452]
MPALQITALPPALHRFAQNPSAIAAIASFGAHALLFALLPLLPSASLSTQEPEIKRSVGVVELTPAEQNRLPEISNSLIELPSIARQPLPSLPYSLNPLPDPPAPSELPPYPGYSSSTSDPILDILRQYSDASKPVLVAPLAPPQPAAPPSKPAESLAPRPNGETQPAPSVPNATQTNPSSPSDTSQTDTSQTADAGLPLPRSLDEVRQAQVERIRQRREQLAQLSTDDTGIGDGAVAANMGTWSQAAGAWLGGDEQKFNQINFKEPTQIVAVYPEAACPLQETRSVWVGVLVGVDGKVVNEAGNRPQILQGSSYRIFNQKAIEDAIAHSFEATGEKKAAILQVNYEYTPEACPDKASPQPNQ